MPQPILGLHLSNMHPIRVPSSLIYLPLLWLYDSWAFIKGNASVVAVAHYIESEG
jgi:hypothetical protein